MKAVLLVSHGSRLSKTKDEVCELIKNLKTLTGISLIEYAFLEIESPSIPDAISLCVQKNADEIIILLNFLNAGRHVDRDIPHILETARRKFPRIKIHMTQPIGQHPAIVDLFAQMILPYLNFPHDS